MYTGAPGDNEALPVNCVIWPVADAFCRSRGARLPTEAELEYVMGGLRSRRHVWGDAPVECADAGIGGKDCTREGVAESGRFPRDKLVLGDRTIVDLVGNLAEWTADRWNSTAANEACFRDHVLRDPRCDEDGVDRPGRRVVKGSGWDLDLVYTGAAFRLGVDGERAYNASVGFRCARDGAPR
jgi:formylglycine-generating enzyme required for sulfatase activity